MSDKKSSTETQPTQDKKSDSDTEKQKQDQNKNQDSDNNSNKESIEWTNENYGYKTTKYNKMICYKPLYAIEMTIYEFCKRLINTPATWKEGKSDIDRRNLSFQLFTTEQPKILMHQYSTIMDNICSKSPAMLEEVISKYDLKDSEISDYMFLALLGKKRNWKEGCAICLTDKIMGTTCGCGHTEIVIFRPCGHSVCASPCFKNFIKTKGTEVKPRSFMVDGVEMIAVGSHNVDLNIKFDCPICTVEVTKTFQAEEVRPGNTLDTAVKKLAQEIYGGLYFPFSF